MFYLFFQDKRFSTPLLLTFLGLPFSKKKEDEEIPTPIVNKMGDFKVQIEKADELFDDNKVNSRL